MWLYKKFGLLNLLRKNGWGKNNIWDYSLLFCYVAQTRTRIQKYAKFLKCRTRGHESIYYIIMNYIN